MRISKEDEDRGRNEKAESNSIYNQKTLIKEFLLDKQDIEIYSEKIDDGYSGTDFNRPAFVEMLEEIREGVINCVVVKDLSRFGRNYIEAGRFIERIFPVLGVRFIAINDNYDSLYEDESMDNILIPFKNLINDAYSYDISIKIRSHLNVKRRNGEFTAAFAPYGYKKSEENKNQLMIDRNVASIIRDIFTLRLEGWSSQRIADKLNSLGIPSPLEYKRISNSKYTTSFQKGFTSRWTSVAVTRILTNEIYIGSLQQGRVSAPSYKVKKQVKKDKKDWICIQEAHEAIIDKDTFQAVGQLMKASLRTSPNHNTEYLLSGKVYCSNCKKNMIRKVVNRNQKVYSYYVCSSYKNFKQCTAHTIQELVLIHTITKILNLFIKLCFDRNKISTFGRIQLNEVTINKVLKNTYNIASNQLDKHKVNENQVNNNIINKNVINENQADVNEAKEKQINENQTKENQTKENQINNKKTNNLINIKQSMKELQKQIRFKEQDITHTKTLKESSYNDYMEGLIDDEEYNFIYEYYEDKLRNLKENIENLKNEYEILIQTSVKSQSKLDYLKINNELSDVDRTFILYMIEKISVIDKYHIEIRLSYQDIYYTQEIDTKYH